MKCYKFEGINNEANSSIKLNVWTYNLELFYYFIKLFLSFKIKRKVFLEIFVLSKRIVKRSWNNINDNNIIENERN